MSKYIVSARKYRPTKFNEIVGQNHVSKTLKNALKTDHLGHSFLFCGPRGVGKTTSARILAKVLNCENRSADFEPCNTCSSCEAFNKNSSFNIYELDAASNNSVDDIRNLVDQVRFPPQQGEYKVYIIDEVHMLSPSAFNAFLKTLEEPPSYAVFILATTEKHKIFPTILSRCQIYDFNRVQVPDIVNHLQFICKEEGITAEESALHVIAQKADGALRDALSLFDRIVSFAGTEVTYQTVVESLNILDYDTFFEFTNALLIQDRNKVLNLFNAVLNKGFDGDQVILGLAEHFRNLLVAKDEAIIDLLEVAPDVKQQYVTQANTAKTSFLLNALNIANQSDITFKQAKNKRLHVELALLKICYLGSTLTQQPFPPNKETVEPVKKNSHSNEVTKSTVTTSTKNPNRQPLPNSSSSGANAQLAQSTQPVNSLQPEELTAKKSVIIPINKDVADAKESIKKPSRQSLFSLANLDEELRKKRVEAESDQESSQKNEEQQDETIDPNSGITIETIQTVWNELGSIFRERSLPTLETAVQDATISFENNRMTVFVIGEIAKQLMLDNYNLIVNFLKQKTKLRKFSFKIEAKELNTKAPKTFTKQEQLEYIKKQNPVIETLCNEFDLEIDY